MSAIKESEKKLKITFSKDHRGHAGLAGHIGVSHVTSHSGFVQEDGAGFSVVTTIINKAASLDLRITKVNVNPTNGEIDIHLKNGGKGKACACDGFTPAEKTLMKNAVGKSAVSPQSLATAIFGRIIGQGVLKVPSAFITAVSKAVVNGFMIHYPHQFIYAAEDTPLSAGCTIGTILRIGDMPVSTMLTINAGEGGIGPNEDTEGNIPIGNKRKLMEKLGLDRLPTIIVESKAFVPAWKEKIKETTLVVRANDMYDNTVVRECLIQGARSLGYPVFQPDNPYPRRKGALSRVQKDISDQIISLGKGLAKAKTSGDKNKIAAQLSMIIKNDLGGITFMSDKINDIFDNGGLLPGTAAVLSSAVTSDYAAKYKIPLLRSDDIKMYEKTIYEALKLLGQKIHEANEELVKKAIFKRRIKSIEKVALKFSKK